MVYSACEEEEEEEKEEEEEEKEEEEEEEEEEAEEWEEEEEEEEEEVVVVVVVSWNTTLRFGLYALHILPELCGLKNFLLMCRCRLPQNLKPLCVYIYFGCRLRFCVCFYIYIEMGWSTWCFVTFFCSYF